MTVLFIKITWLAVYSIDCSIRVYFNFIVSRVGCLVIVLLFCYEIFYDKYICTVQITLIH